MKPSTALSEHVREERVQANIAGGSTNSYENSVENSVENFDPHMGHREDTNWEQNIRDSVQLHNSEEHGYELVINARSIYDLFQNFLRKEKGLSSNAAAEYGMKNFCSKLTSMQSNYGILKKRISQGVKYVFRLNQLVDEFNIDQTLN